MTRISILLIAVVFSVASFAQGSRSVKSGYHNDVLRALLQPQGSHTPAMKSTAGVSMERVIAQNTRDNVLATRIDSLNLKYGIGHGSFYDYNDMIFPYNYPYNAASPMFNYAGVFTTPQVMFDTLRHWTVDPNTLVFGYYETGLATYDGSNNLTNYKALYVDSSFYPNTIHVNTFVPATSNISMGISSNWIGGVADSAFKQYFSYNTSGHLVKDSTYELHLGTWRLASKSLYTYDVSNNLIQIDNYSNTTDTSFTLPLVEGLQYINTYDGSNRLATVQANYLYSGGLSAYTRDTFAYTGTYSFHTSWKQYQYDTINHYWAPMFYMTKNINGIGRPDTVNIKNFDSLLNTWLPQTMDIVHYNGSNDPDTLKDFEYNFTSFPSTPNFTTVYYYETYVNLLGVEDVHANNVKVYPNPANNYITISQPGMALNTPVTLTLTNSLGQSVVTERLYWKGDMQMSLAGLATGTYWLVIRDGSGNIVHRGAVSKL